jgi:selenophosphate synthase
VNWGSTSELERALLIDPQTSGGLLVVISPERVREYLSLAPSAVEIGDVISWSGAGVALV